jgi:dCTP diphosphatase
MRAGEVKTGLPEFSSKERTDLEEELSDVFIYLMRLSQVCHVDLPKVAAAKIEKNKLKYPAEKCFNSMKKYNQL